MSDVKSWTCPKCGQVNTSKFCTGCGTKRPSETWTCPNCGAENTGKFCTKCGQKRADDLGQTQPLDMPAVGAPQRTTPEPVIKPSYETPQQPAQQVPPAMQGRMVPPQGNVPQPDQSKGKQIALIVVIIVLLGVLGSSAIANSSRMRARAISRSRSRRRPQTASRCAR